MKRSQIVMVTGASAGLGRAIAHGFAKRGARIGLIARNAEALEACSREVRQLGGHAVVLPLDVSDPEAVDQAASKLEEVFGPIDVWVNDAMVSVFSPVKKMRPEEYRRVTEVTYLGYVYGTLAALQRMLPRDHGTIIQIGSALSERSIPLQSAYCACKHAIVGFTDSLRCELHHDQSNVQLTVVQMPAMNTMQFTWVKSRLPDKPQPVPPIFQPEIAAAVVVHAASVNRPRREYWVGTSTMKAIIGQKFIPGLLDRYLGRTGYKSQQTDTPDCPERANNLWEPVLGMHSAHGPFDDRSKTFSAQVFADIHREWFIGVGLLLVAAIAIRRRKRLSSSEEGKTMSQLMKVEDPIEKEEDVSSIPGSIHKWLAIACCCTAIALLTPVALVQLKLTKRLPDLPGRLFNSRKIVLSKSAYKLGIPDGLLGIISYSITLALLIAAQPSRPVVRGMLRGKLLLDGSIAARKSRRQFKEFGRVCSWCVGVSVATAGVLYFARKARQVPRPRLVA